MTGGKVMISQDVSKHCCESRPCAIMCPLLEDSAPAEIASAVLDEAPPFEVIHSVSRCSFCGLCNEACPYGVNIKEIMGQAKSCLIETNAIDPEWYRHLWVDHDWNMFTLYRKEYGLDKAYEDLIKDRCTTLFMPGCMLANEGPQLVRSAVEWLTRRGEDVGISVQCCGAILDEMGTQKRAEKYSTELWNQICRTGARQVVTACPTCQARMLLTGADNNVTVVSLFQLMAEEGVRVPVRDSQTITVHDSCTDRNGRIGADVRALLEGHELVEMRHTGRNTICCGSGGLVSAIDPELCRTRARERLNEIEEVNAETCVTYCMSCAHRLTGSGATNVRHILELVFDEEVNHEQFDTQAHALFEGEQGSENCQLLQTSKPSI